MQGKGPLKAAAWRSRGCARRCQRATGWQVRRRWSSWPRRPRLGWRRPSATGRVQGRQSEVWATTPAGWGTSMPEEELFLMHPKQNGSCLLSQGLTNTQADAKKSWTPLREARSFLYDTLIEQEGLPSWQLDPLSRIEVGPSQ